MRRPLGGAINEVPNAEHISSLIIVNLAGPHAVRRPVRPADILNNAFLPRLNLSLFFFLLIVK